MWLFLYRAFPGAQVSSKREFLSWDLRYGVCQVDKQEVYSREGTPNHICKDPEVLLCKASVETYNKFSMVEDKVGKRCMKWWGCLVHRSQITKSFLCYKEGWAGWITVRFAQFKGYSGGSVELLWIGHAGPWDWWRHEGRLEAWDNCLSSEEERYKNSSRRWQWSGCLKTRGEGLRGIQVSGQRLLVMVVCVTKTEGEAGLGTEI